MALLELALLTQTLLPADLRAPGLDDQVVRALRSKGRPPPQPFTITGEPAHGPVPFPPAEPATWRGGRLMDLLAKIEATGTDTTYSHSTRIDRGEGKYHFDCSGMMNWLLSRASPKAREALERKRPVASTYVRVIANAPTHKRRKGWQRVDDIEEVRPGDVFAWRRPPTWPKGGNTGHVGVVAEAPAAVDFIKNAYLIRVIDSTRYAHQHDERSQTGATGFGSGVILFMADDDGHPVGYGWYGTQSGGWYETEVVFGRI